MKGLLFIVLILLILGFLMPTKIEPISFEDLPKSELKFYKSDCTDFKKYTFTKVPLKSLLTKSALGIPYKDLVSKNKVILGKYYSSLGVKINYYTLIDKDLLKILKFISDSGFKFEITSSHRTPQYNQKVGGKRCSYHTKGQAIDIKCNKKDELQKLLEKTYPNSLGIGNYKKYPKMNLTKNF